MDKSKELEFESTGKLLWKYFVPAFIGLIVQALYNIVDRIFIGNYVGVDAFSGLTLVFPIMMMIMAFGTLTGVGTGVLVSINMGRKDQDTAQRILGTGFTASLIVGTLVMILGFIIKDPLLRSLHPQPATLKYANDYLNIILFGVLFQTTGWGLNNVIRSQGYVKTSMYSMLISGITNAVLAGLFVVVFGWGVKGAAFATLISMFILALWVVIQLTRKNTFIKLRLKYMGLDFPLLKEILGIGLAAFAINIANAAVQLILNGQLIKYGGDKAVAVMGVIGSVSSLSFMTIFGLNMASQPIIGYNFGAKKFDRVKSTLKLSMVWATVIGFMGFFVSMFFPELLIKAFNSQDKDLLNMGVIGLRICFLVYPLIGMQIIASNYFQSTGKARTAAFLSLLRQVLILIPLIVVLPRFFGLLGIWYSWPISDLLSAIITFYYIRKEWRRLY
jgi:putative MATE family efflux protein